MGSSIVSVSSSITRNSRCSLAITAGSADNSGITGTCASHRHVGFRFATMVFVRHRAGLPTARLAGGDDRRDPKNVTYGSEYPLMSAGSRFLPCNMRNRSCQSQCSAASYTSGARKQGNSLVNHVFCFSLGRFFRAVGRLGVVLATRRPPEDALLKPPRSSDAAPAMSSNTRDRSSSSRAFELERPCRILFGCVSVSPRVDTETDALREEDVLEKLEPATDPASLPEREPRLPRAEARGVSAPASAGLSSSKCVTEACAQSSADRPALTGLWSLVPTSPAAVRNDWSHRNPSAVFHNTRSHHAGVRCSLYTKPFSRCTLNVGMCALAGLPSSKPMNASPRLRAAVSWSVSNTARRRATFEGCAACLSAPGSAGASAFLCTPRPRFILSSVRDTRRADALGSTSPTESASIIRRTRSFEGLRSMRLVLDAVFGKPHSQR
mmetsp:Transcript_5955/g.24150  ORF Transcript_5955/g.24150 Transcript_5955/m.24150 type:complete len:438 (-) Transcript_5955:1332-2645(-)